MLPGLLHASFIPPQPIRELPELRELTRYRHEVLHARTQEANRLQKVVEGANIKLGAVATDIKLGAVATDILGKSGQERARPARGHCGRGRRGQHACRVGARALTRGR